MTDLIPLDETNITDQPDFDLVVDATLSTVKASTARIYARTYADWFDWAHKNEVNTLDLRAATVRDFLRSRPVTKGTRQRQLSALRKLVRVMALDYRHPEYRAMYESLLLLRAPEDGTVESKRLKRALPPPEVLQVIEAWPNDDRPVNLRNRALLTVMFYTGARRSEIAAIRWRDIDLEEGTVHIRAGKGDKPRDAAIVGINTMNPIRQWRLLQRSFGEREYVFCAVLKGDKLGKDQPMTTSGIWRVCKEAEKRTGIEFKPHDARRTLATELLTLGAPVADVQAQLGHANASTTIQNYAMPADARSRRKSFKTRY